MEVKIEYKGEAYSLEKGKVYLLKVLKGKVTSEAASQISMILKGMGVEVVLVGVDNINDLSIEPANDDKVD